VLELARDLGPVHLDAIAGLERRVVAADGGRLKLEWGTLRSRPGTRVDDVLWWDGDRLVGFLGLYSFGAPTVELAGMVDPAARRRGVATALIDAALPLCDARGWSQRLLVTPRTSAGGQALAASRGAVLDHSEHAMELRGDPAPGPEDPAIAVRPGTEADADAVFSLLKHGFGWQPAASAQELPASFLPQSLTVERDGEVVATLRLEVDGDSAGVHGFVVRPDLQGRGIGRDVLRRVCRQARARGATSVHLEVAVENDRALGLYTSLGFERVLTEDYFALPGAQAGAV